MRRAIARSSIVVSLLAIAPAAAYGQAQATAVARYVTISGRVIDDDKAPVPSAELGLKLMGYAPNTARSGNDGHFEFSNVPLTTGSITVRRLGYRSQTLTL